MKNLSIKFIGLLVILLFCLSPLGAIDLNQGDNATHLNDNNGTDIKDVNDTIKDNDTVKVNDKDIEDKSVNGTDVDLNNGENVEIQNMSSNDSNSSQKLNEQVDPELHVKADDITCGETVVLKMWITNEEVVYLPVTVTITCPNYSDEFNMRVWRSQGVNEFKIKDLPPGNYVVTVDYPGSSFYNPTKLTTFFSVNKHKINLKTQVDDVEMGKTPVLRVTSEKGLKGNITIYSNWSGEKFTVDASDESFSYDLDRNMAPGNYCCIVTYSGDDTHDSAISASFFSVNKHDPNATVEVDDIVQGDDIFVKFHANKALNCDVKYVVLTVPSSPSNSSLKDGSIMHVKLVNGEANATLENSLGPGRYFVAGTVEGDDNFKAADFYKEFKVNPAN